MRLAWIIGRLGAGGFFVYVAAHFLAGAHGTDPGSGASNPGAAIGAGAGLLFLYAFGVGLLVQGLWWVLSGAWRLRRLFLGYKQERLQQPDRQEFIDRSNRVFGASVFAIRIAVSGSFIVAGALSLSSVSTLHGVPQLFGPLVIFSLALVAIGVFWLLRTLRTLRHFT